MFLEYDSKVEANRIEFTIVKFVIVNEKKKIKFKDVFPLLKIKSNLTSMSKLVIGGFLI